MSLFYAPLFSGSSGNAVYIGDGHTHLLTDAGVACSRVAGELKKIGIEPGQLSAVLITHAHIDHVKGLGVLARRYAVPVYLTEDCLKALPKTVGELPPCAVCPVLPGRDFYIGNINIMPFATPHDSPGSVGYSFSSEGARFSLATDIGSVKDGWFKEILGSDAVLLESNYDEDMLTAGPYTYQLKRRIMSSHGHLSNNSAAACAVRLADSGARHLILGHLSKENNAPELARVTAESALLEAGYEPGKDIRLDVAPRDETLGLFEIMR